MTNLRLLLLATAVVFALARPRSYTLSDSVDASCPAASTPCAAAYSGNGQGCCVLINAVCCPNNQTCCPHGFTCRDTGTYLTTCVRSEQPSQQGLSVCKFGAALPPSSTQPNVLVIGDSVSIGYTPHLAQKLASDCLVQHSPWDTRDGGAEETAYGLQCIDMFLRSPNQTLFPADVIVFNWGIHNTNNDTTPGQGDTPTHYQSQLAQIISRIRSTLPSAKLLFAQTTPLPYSVEKNDIVIKLNSEALSLLETPFVPNVNLYQKVIDKCGPVPYDNCSISLNSPGHPNPHYTSEGYEYLATFLAEAVRKLL